MLTPPASLLESALLQVVRESWCSDADGLSYLPVGFGAHHWRVERDGAPLLFLTWDRPQPPRRVASFTQAYAAAAELAACGLPGVVPPIPATGGRLTVPLGAGLLSATPWLHGRTPTHSQARQDGHAQQVAALLTALHGAEPPSSIPVWEPFPSGGLAATWEQATARTWRSGPFAEQARQAIRAGLESIATWAATHQERAARAVEARTDWVPTHGEPHSANQMVTDEGVVLVDWESLALAPAERDLRSLPTEHRGLADREMLELFALEWRLSEIQVYAEWFRGPHAGDEDDQQALRDLLEELEPAVG